MATASTLNPGRGWANCTKCEGMFWTGASDGGVCAAGGAHQVGTDRYALSVGNPFAAGDLWHRCAKCAGLFKSRETYPPYVLWRGSCPAGEEHDPTGSGSYTVGSAGDQLNPPPNARANTDWSQCRACGALVTKDGVCPATHQAHQPDPDSRRQVLQRLDDTPWEKVLQPATTAPWPAFTDGAEKLAYQAFGDALRGTTRGDDIRAAYAKLSGNQLSNMHGDLLHRSLEPPPEGVPSDVWKAVYEQLHAELEAVSNVLAYFENLRAAVDEAFLNRTWVTERVTAIMEAEQDLPEHPGFDFLSILMSVLGIVVGVVTDGIGEVVAPAVQTAIEGAVDVVEASVSAAIEAAGSHEDWTNRDPFQATVADIWEQLSESFGQVHDTLAATQTAVLSDWGKLQEAIPLTAEADTYRTVLGDLWQRAYEVSLYQILFPVRFGVWNAFGEPRAPRWWPVRSTFVEDFLATLDRDFSYVAAHTSTRPQGHNVDAVTVIVKRELLDRDPYVFGAYGLFTHQSTPTSTDFPSKALMDRLWNPGKGPSINRDVFFAGGGGWESMKRKRGELVYDGRTVGDTPYPMSLMIQPQDRRRRTK